MITRTEVRAPGIWKRFLYGWEIGSKFRTARMNAKRHVLEVSRKPVLLQDRFFLQRIVESVPGSWSIPKFRPLDADGEIVTQRPYQSSLAFLRSNQIES